MGSRPLDRLRSHVDGAGAKLVLTGDNRQLSSIDAGGALRSLVERTRRPRRHPHHQPPPGRLRPAMGTRRPRRSPRRRCRRAVHAYTEHGRVTISGTIDEARHRLVEDWWAVHRDHTTAILAVRRADVVALNEMVRARRHVAGELGGEMRFGTKALRVGDRVLFEKNQRVAEAATGRALPVRLQVRNGTFGTVVGGVDPVGNAPTRGVTFPGPRVTLLARGSEGPGRGDLGAGGRARRRSSGRSPWQLCRDLDQPRLCPHRVPLPGDHCRPHLRPRGRQPLPGGRLHPAVSRTAVQQPLRRSP